MTQERDPKLWQIAKSRAQFRKNIFTYMVICLFLWAIWWFTQGRHTGITGYPWPLWVMLGWGVNLAFQYFNAYLGNKDSLTEEEYEKLKKQQ